MQHQQSHSFCSCSHFRPGPAHFLFTMVSQLKQTWLISGYNRGSTRSPLYLGVFVLWLFVFGESESSGAWDHPSWRKPNIDREGNLFILRGRHLSPGGLGSSTPPIYIIMASVLFRQGWGKFSQHTTTQNIESAYCCHNLWAKGYSRRQNTKERCRLWLVDAV